jgi:hypothetical protein
MRHHEPDPEVKLDLGLHLDARDPEGDELLIPHKGSLPGCLGNLGCATLTLIVVAALGYATALGATVFYTLMRGPHVP